MGSQGSGSNGVGGARIQAQGPNLNPNLLGGQGSFYSLTLDEVQNQLGELGKPLGTMNLDELVKTLCSAEANDDQGVGGVGYGLSAVQTGKFASGRQPGFTMSGDLSGKTVNEVWQNIQEEKRGGLDRKATLGKMTLEDFLVKAGVVVESTHKKKSLGSVMGAVDSMGLPQEGLWNYNPTPLIHPQQLQQQQPQVMLPVFVPGHPVQQPVTVTYPETQIAVSSSPLMGALSDSQTQRRKRAALDDIGERGVERRQKRMIKNRESAARSRARKQAYTHELESKVSHLEEENARLKRLQVLEKALLPSTVPPHQLKHQLRRASSAPL